MSNYRMINEQWTGNDLEGNSHDVHGDISPVLSDWGKPQENLS